MNLVIPRIRRPELRGTAQSKQAIASKIILTYLRAIFQLCHLFGPLVFEVSLRVGHAYSALQILPQTTTEKGRIAAFSAS